MSTTDDQTPTNDFVTPKFILRATILAAVVLTGLVVSVIFLFQRPPAVDASVPACQRPASQDRDVDGKIPVDRFQAYGAALVPVTAYGPSTTTPAPTCYEHSPAGASAAAASIASLASASQYAIILNHLSLDTPAADMMREDVAEAGVPEVIPTVAATRIDAYTGDTATVRVALEAPGDSIGRPRVAQDIDLVWQDGWKWDIPAATPDYEPVYTLNGYNAFDTPEEGPAHG